MLVSTNLHSCLKHCFIVFRRILCAEGGSEKRLDVFADKILNATGCWSASASRIFHFFFLDSNAISFLLMLVSFVAGNNGQIWSFWNFIFWILSWNFAVCSLLWNYFDYFFFFLWINSIRKRNEYETLKQAIATANTINEAKISKYEQIYFLRPISNGKFIFTLTFFIENEMNAHTNNYYYYFPSWKCFPTIRSIWFAFVFSLLRATVIFFLIQKIQLNIFRHSSHRLHKEKGTKSV